MEPELTGVLTPTLRKFGAPGSVVRDYPHWLVLLRPQQVTLGALVLIAKAAATAWPMLSAAAFAELKVVTADLEQALQRAFGHDKINYLMLMMVDPDVHFHVLPRYRAARTFAAREFVDPGWPGAPRLDVVNATDDAVAAALRAELMSCWPK